MSSYLRLLRHRNFRNLFLGQSASAVGDQVVIVALALYITQRTGSATDLGTVLAAGSLSLVALLLFGGVWADRLPRQRIMLVADGARALLHAVLAVLILAGGASVGEMVLIEALFGAARAFFQPAYTGLLPQTVPPALLQDARALSASTENVAILVGPALGTALVLGVGAGEAFALDAATFLLSALLLSRVRFGEATIGETASAPAAGVTEGALVSAGTPPAERATVWRDLRDGWREVRSRPWVWVTIAAFTICLLTAYAQWYALAPVIARRDYGGAGLFGVLESVAGGGAVIGSLVGMRWRPRRPLLTGLLLCLLWPVQSILFGLRAPVAAVIALAAAAGWGFSLFGIWWETALAHHIPARALSRVSAYDWMGSLALLPVGFVIAGPLATAFGARQVLIAGAVIAFVTMSLALLPRSTRDLRGSAQHRDGDVAEERGGEPEVADVDPLVGTVDERRGLE